MTSSISHLRLRRWNTTLKKKKTKKNQAESNFFGGFFVNCPKSVGRFLVSYCAFIVALLLWPLCWLVSSDPYALLWEHWLRWHACHKIPSVGWRCLASAASCVFFFFRGWFLSVLFLKFLLKTRDPGFSRFFHRLGMKTLIFRLGMPPEWRHGDDSNTWEFWDITQGDLKHCLQYAGQSHCLGSRHVIIRKSGFYARNPLGTIPKHQLNRCGFVGDENMLVCFGWWICEATPQPTAMFFFSFCQTRVFNRLQPRMSCCPCIVSCYSMFLDQFSANAFVDLVLHSSPLWPAMNNADLVMEKCQTTANSLKLGLMNIHWKTEIFNDMIFVSTSHL